MEGKENTTLTAREMLEEMANHVFYDKSDIEYKINQMCDTTFGDCTNRVKEYYNKFLQNKEDAPILFIKLTGLPVLDPKYRKSKSRKVKVKIAGYSYTIQFVDDPDNQLKILKPVKCNIGITMSGDKEEEYWGLNIPVNRIGYEDWVISVFFKLENGERTLEPLYAKVRDARERLQRTFYGDEAALKVTEI